MFRSRFWRIATIQSVGLVAIAVGLSRYPTAAVASAQNSAKVDFRRDIQPLFAEYCVECHGPAEQMGGLRLDQRSSALKLAQSRIVPGSSTYSLVYQRLLHDRFGPRMPPTEPLRADQITLVRDWIEQGAEWPDDLANDAPPPVPDAVATALIEAVRSADRPTFRRLAAPGSAAVTRKGPGGATALMHAALYADLDAMRVLLDSGADPNASNEAGANALMWAVHSLPATRLLLDHGADVNARSTRGQNALAIAAGRSGAKAVVALLLERGARATGAALVAAATANDSEIFQLLVAHGADVKSVAPRVLTAAMRAHCQSCVDAVIDFVDHAGLNSALLMLSPFGETRSLSALLTRGANADTVMPNARPDLAGRTPLMLAASSDFIPVDTVRMLIARGADVNAKGPLGETALDLARRNGQTRVVDLLVQAGATGTATFRTPTLRRRRAASVNAAIQRILPVLQRSGVTFIEKTGCISCHHNTMTAMAIATVRAKRLPVDETTARNQRTRIVSLLESQRDLVRMGGTFITNTASNVLASLAAVQHPPDETTDAFAYFLATRQLADGRWRNFSIDHRPPIQGSDVEVTATAVRALGAYAPAAHRPDYQKTIERAVAWLKRVSARTTDERSMQLLGLTWAGVSPNHEAIRHAGNALKGEQRADGGWGQLSTLASDPYATGQALVALHASGMLRARDEAYARGVEFLMRTQLEDGSWYVKTRALPFQPYFESGFPHGADQWISIAATNWAVMALANAIPDDAMARTQSGVPRAGVFRDCSDCPEMVTIPSGEFIMGSDPSELGRSDREGPQRRVSVPAFAVGKLEVTRSQWAAFVSATNRPVREGCYWTGRSGGSLDPIGSWRDVGFHQDDNHPVVCVTWHDAQDYVRWLSQRTGRTYRLLSEAEWEYAARARSTTPYAWGDTASHEYANYGTDMCCSGAASGRDRWVNTAPGGSFPANGFDLHDMHGNVLEWVQDCFASGYPAHPIDGSAYEADVILQMTGRFARMSGTSSCAYRMLRGGDWGNPPALIRSASRNFGPGPGATLADYRSGGVGFRIAVAVK
jgi:formylglycine-generating enzyme required for sulfatase activity/ankyrin repeat protein